MPRELLILCHGKAHRNKLVDDHRRPLKDSGKRDAQRIGTWLFQQDLLPDQILTSTAERTWTTAQKCVKVMAITAQQIHPVPLLYHADLQTLLTVLATASTSARRTLLVGHSPGLEHLLTYLADAYPAIPSGDKPPATATLARLAMHDDWHDLQAGGAKLLNLIQAKDLPEKFPYPAPDGNESRERPDYYYTQSAVIPYRLNEGEVQILIIRSSGDKHWVVPKGIADPGYTLQDSAAKEAWEEAGVEGKVIPEALGSFQYQKWGATCSVTVDPMEVTHLVPVAQWQERHRGRRWVSAADAASLLNQHALASMVLKLDQQLRGESGRWSDG